MATRVVIAEDEWLIAAQTRQAVSAWGHEVVGMARSGLEALELCRAERPDLVLMDVRMPELDGLEATRRLMESHPLCVVIVTGDRSLAAGARAAGAMGSVVKPLLPAAIPAIIQDAQQRFARFTAVCTESDCYGTALSNWLLVESAVEALAARYGINSAQAFARLERAAVERRVSLAAAAETGL